MSRELDLKVHELVFGVVAENVPHYSTDHEAMSKLKLFIVNQANEKNYPWAGPARQLITRMVNLYDLNPIDLCEAIVRIYSLDERYKRAPGQSDAEREARYQKGIAKIKAELFKTKSFERLEKEEGLTIIFQYPYDVDEIGFKFGGFLFGVNNHKIGIVHRNGRMFHVYLQDEHFKMLQELELDFIHIENAFLTLIAMARGRIG